jgi:hypothetical protein
MRSNKRNELTTNGIANAVFRSPARALSDRLLVADKAARRGDAEGSFDWPNLIHPNNGGPKMDEANPMIVPKLVAVTKADWRMQFPPTLASPNYIHPSNGLGEING